MLVRLLFVRCCVCVYVYQFKDSFLVRNRFFTHSKVGLDQKRIYLRKKRVSRQPKTGANITVLVQRVFSNKFNILVVFRVARRYWRFTSLFKFNFPTILSMPVFFFRITYKFFKNLDYSLSIFQIMNDHKPFQGSCKAL